MKKLVISILFILVGVFVGDRLGGMVMWWINQHTHDTTGPKMKYMVNEMKEDVLLLGASKCQRHYVSSIISDTLGMSVYNGGIDATNNIFAHYISLNYVLTHHTPKIVCLELFSSDYAPAPHTFDAVSFFAPYIGLSEGADSIFRLAGSYWKYQVSHLYRYNSRAVTNIFALLVNRLEGEDNGYLPNPKPTHFVGVLLHSRTPKQIDKLKFSYVRKFITLCKQKNIRLIFMVSPTYMKVDPDNYAPLKELAKQNNIPFLDYHTSGLFQDHPEYFVDTYHLWDQPARAFSSIFASDLKRTLDSLSLIKSDTADMKKISMLSH